MTLALLGVSALAAACVQATTGLGFALVLTPVALALLRPAGAIVIVTALGLLLNLLVLLTEGRRPRVAWREVVPILFAAAPGTACGVLLLRALPKPVLQVGVGVVLLVGVLLGQARARRAVDRRGAGDRGRTLRTRSRTEPSRGAPARLGIGFTTGVLSTSTGVSGPPIALWLSRINLSPGEVRDSLSAAFLALGLIAGLALVPVLHRAHLDADLVAVGIAGVLGGHAIGSRAFVRVQEHRFSALVRAVIACAGAASIIAGAAAL